MDRHDPGETARRADGEGRTVVTAGRRIGYWAQGVGAPVVLIASAGREASDFNELAETLVGAGRRTLAVDPPGVGDSDLPAGPMTLFDLADDIEAVLKAEGGAPAVVIGHAFGNRVARAFATRFPQRVSAVVLIAAGGRRPTPEAAHKALLSCFDPALTDDERLRHIRYGFFADENSVPDYWRRGWHGLTATLQGAATRATPSASWWAGGSAPMLVVQADCDRIAPKEDTADLLAADYPDRVEVALIPGAGHAPSA